METLGKRITYYRKKYDLTQEQLAETMGVSPQAVSKWENDLSCPDITMLPKLSEIFHVSVDELLKGQEKQAIRLLEPDEQKNIDKMLIKVRVSSHRGDKIKVNCPVSLLKMARDIGLEIPQFDGKDILSKIDIDQIIRMVDAGIIGKLVEVESADGDIIEIIVE